jgi:hypothetical protein
MVKPVGNALEGTLWVTADDRQRFTQLPDLMEDAKFVNDL